jgi:hypothetical protein
VARASRPPRRRGRELAERGSYGGDLHGEAVR